MWLILCCFTQIVAYGVKASECTLPLGSVEDICVYGNDKSFIPDGVTFEFFSYDSTTSSNIYVCEECWGLSFSRAYLYVCIDEPTDDYFWVIGSDYQSCSAWSSCYVGNSLGPNYNFDINSCFNAGNWNTYNGTQLEWQNDIDMRLSVCNPICYETDICPQTLTNIQTTKTVEKINIKIDKSSSWNGDLYFDFSISQEDCMDPQLSFEYELIDYDDIYENIQIYDDNNTLIATCNGGQACGTFDSCLIDYDIDDIIPMDETYSIMIHQTANYNINNLCGDYILNAVLTLTCITDNINTSIVYETLENQCGKREDISTTWFTSTKTRSSSTSRSSTLSTKTSKLKKKNNNSTWSIVGGVGIAIVLIIGWCMYKMKREVICCITIVLIICCCMAKEKADKYVKKQKPKVSMATIPKKNPETKVSIPQMMVLSNQNQTILFVKTTVVKTT